MEYLFENGSKHVQLLELRVYEVNLETGGWRWIQRSHETYN